MKAPEPNEIELTVFGPGYGECIVVHMGSGKWAIIDSCLDDALEPASLSYLAKIDVSVEQAVVSVSASHWHDDHVKGLARTVEACRTARLSFGAALQSIEFVAFLQAHEDQPVRKLDRGGTELLNCLRLVVEQGRTIKPLHEDTIIVDFDDHQLAHGLRVEMRALSPSGIQFSDFLRRIGSFPGSHIGQAKGRISEPSRNDLSVAMLFMVGDQAVLLGGDLEQLSDSQKGWQAVVEGRRGRRPLAQFFKVPHHGSHNAHNDDVWTEMLTELVSSIVTPWTKGGRRLPSDTDLDRLGGLSDKCYLTSSRLASPKKRYSAEVMKLVKAADVKLDTSIYSGGQVTIRWVPNDGPPTIQLFNGAIVV